MVQEEKTLKYAISPDWVTISETQKLQRLKDYRPTFVDCF